MSNATLFVSGASGKLGRRVVELLLEAGESNVIAGSRSTDKLIEFANKGVDLRPADFDNPDQLAESLQGVDRFLLISTDALGQPGKRLEQHKKAIEAAKKAGVKHVVYTSLARAEADNPVLIAPDHHGTEVALKASGLGSTFLRNNMYTDVLLMGLPGAVARGQHFSATKGGKAAYVTREDCARVAAAALADDFEGQRTLEVSGPEAITQEELVAIASDVTGKPVQHIEISNEELTRAMAGATGMPEALAKLFTSFDEGIAQGYHELVTDVVESLTGKKPQTVRDFLSANKEALLG
ncbi:SDR family oxidoreductase [bacterium]|nr:SDR family oxidoreductase [bacterium]